MVKILLTGGSGFIGRNLKNRLKLSNSEIISPNHYVLDLLNESVVDELFNTHKKFDVVLHCAIRGASRVIPKEVNMLYENIYAFENLQRYNKQIGKFIYFGSLAEANLKCYYGLSKFIISNRLKQMENGYNIRLCNIFGEDEQDWKFIKNSILSALKNLPINITQNRYIDFFYIEDLCRLVEYYINNNKLNKEIDAVYSSKNIPKTLTSAAHMIKLLCNSQSKLFFEKEGLSKSYVGTIGKEILKIEKSFIGFQNGIENEINYIKKEMEN